MYSWRYNLADALRDCATVYGRIIGGQPVTADEHLKLMSRLNAVMVQLRSLMPSVSKEVKVSMTELDAIQRNLRMCNTRTCVFSSSSVVVVDARTSILVRASTTTTEEEEKTHVRVLHMRRLRWIASSSVIETLTSLDTDGISERSCTITAFSRLINFKCSSAVTGWPPMIRPYTVAQSRNASARL